ncbi:MAG: GT4 family glycosyltransferase PelF [Rhodocyclaceae bacterium]|jgi:glycosyltransferase involved in cell wall biosynthesis|nr:GT4 family glycosyltransferase PelF [Rhodocyclaceae bacterium]
MTRKAPELDVLLLLEGTYPYVAGGVSSWVHALIQGYPQLRFGAVFIGSRREDYGARRYTLPENFVFLEELYLFATEAQPPVAPVKADPQVIENIRQLHACYVRDRRSDQLPRHFARAIEAIGPGGRLDHATFLYSEGAWEIIKDFYRAHCTDPSFVDYFWTVRTLHTPFWQLRTVIERLPPARIYHAVSTGYAGLLGLMLKQVRPHPFLLSEHGIYVKERKIDLFQAQWIKDNRGAFERDPGQISYFRQLWIRFFETLGYLTYQAADEIVALYEANRQRQIHDGAPPERTQCIPNGIDIARYAPLRSQRPAAPPPILCLIGRVVTIKDVKTYIRALPAILEKLPQAEAWIAGPEDEDPAYAEECRALAKSLEVADKVKFLGFQKLTDLLPKIGLVVLSSISEALPLVVLEGYAAGIPAVCTDVGSCRQLVYGLPGEDAALGASGRIVRIADPEGLAQAALELLTDHAAWQAASMAAIQRVERYYDQDMMFARYRELYRKHGAWQA